MNTIHLLKVSGLLAIICLSYYLNCNEHAISSRNITILSSVPTRNSIVSSVEMNFLNNKYSENYDFKTSSMRKHVRPVLNGHRTDLVPYKGRFIPAVSLPEITIVGERIRPQGITSAQCKGSAREGRLTIRESFDRLLIFVTDRFANFIRRYLPEQEIR